MKKYKQTIIKKFQTISRISYYITSSSYWTAYLDRVAIHSLTF